MKSTVGISFFIFVAVIGAILVLFLMSSFGPKDRETGFWAGLQKFRKWLDAFSYYFYSGAALFLIILGVILYIRSR